MAREPVTRMQLDAYRFGQRRLESALARRDPVLLHEEIRGQRRVVVTGLALAMLALVGAFGYAKVAGKPAWERQSIIAAKQSGRLFVVVHKPDRLVPVRNMVAARLVQAAAGKNAGPGAANGEATVLDDAVLQQAPRTATVGVSGADGVRLPTGEDPSPVGPWAVCDLANPSPQTIVVGGSSPSTPMPAEQGLLLESPDRDLYLVTGGHRYRMDSVYPLQRAYDLVDVQPRKVSNAFLTAIPQGRPLQMPVIPNVGTAAPGGLPANVGDVVRAAGAGEKYYLVLRDGVQEVPRPVANLIRTGPGVDRSQPPTLVSSEQINAVKRVSLAGLDQFPSVIPRVPEGASDGALCWQWGNEGKDGAVSVAQDAPVPPGQQRTRLAQADGAGPRLDVVSVPTGVPVVVRTVADRDGGGGGLWLVSDTGVGYQIAAGSNANNETATALGIQPDSASPAPEQALRLLPAGPDLDLQSATRTVDVLVNAGDPAVAPAAAPARTQR